jgi:two-component system chemotaxis sensor kinase CheA
MEFDDEIREFLIESDENLANLDREIVLLEQNPKDMQLISSAFRTIHTIKGTCGFFGFSILGSVTHITENILSQVREGQRDLTPELISLVLEAVDAVKAILARIEATGAEGEDETGPLRDRLEAAHREGASIVARPVEAGPPALLNSSPPCSEAPILAKVLPVEPSPMALAEPLAPEVAIQDQANRDSVLKSTPSKAPTPADPLPITLQPSNEHPVMNSKRDDAEDGAGSVPPVTPISTQAIPSAPHTESGASVQAPTTNQSRDAARSTGTDGNREANRDAQLADSAIRVDVALLNRLMNLVGELVLARNQLLQDTSSHSPALQQTSQRLNLITSELQEGVMKTRMQPIGVIWNKLPRIVRDLASQCGKRIHIEMEGANTELDKTIIEAIKDPLTHIVRNSCDHGIEMPNDRLAKQKKPEGLLLLRAYHEGGVVNIEISDDGAGINPEKVKAKAIEKGLLRPEQAAQLSEREAIHIIFLPGFSTAAAITSISGRGVGMDVVKTNIEKIGGSVEVQNRTTGGTIIRIKIPLTLAIIPGLVVTLQRSGNPSTLHESETEDMHAQGRRLVESSGGYDNQEERFIIPQANLLELVRLEGAEQLKRIENVHGTPVFHHSSKLLPLVYLSRVLGRSRQSQGGEAARIAEAVNIIVVQAENRQMGLVVDRICDTQEIVVKPLGRQLKGLVSYVGATIMGDGRPALILDVAGVARLAGLGGQTRQPLATEESIRTDSSNHPQMLLLFRAGPYERVAVPLSLVDRLEEINMASVERAAGRSVLYYRGDILPLISISAALNAPTDTLSASGGYAQVIVFARGAKRIGLVVDKILDIVYEQISAQRPTTVPGLLGSGVVSGRITDLLDLDSLVESTGDSWHDLADNLHPSNGATPHIYPLSMSAVVQ